MSFGKRQFSTEDRAKKCYLEKFPIEIFSFQLQTLLDNYRTHKSLSCEGLFLGLISTVSILTCKSSIMVKAWCQPLTIYSILVGPVSAKKSFYIQLFKKSFSEMTKILIDLGYFRIASDSTNNKFSSLPSQNNSLTIESLFKELSCCSELMQYWDEFSTLLGSFGMYKAGKEGFDRSIFLTLYNGEADLSVSYKSFGYGINESRISIFAAGHPDKIVELVEEEKSSRADGFISRFLVCCPEPVRLKLSQQTHYENKINILNLLVAIKLFFQKPYQITFTEAAFKLLDEEIHLYNKMCAKFELSETFIGATYGKSCGHLLRLSGIMHILEEVLKIVETFFQLHDS